MDIVKDTADLADGVVGNNKAINTVEVKLKNAAETYTFKVTVKAGSVTSESAPTTITVNKATS